MGHILQSYRLDNGPAIAEKYWKNGLTVADKYLNVKPLAKAPTEGAKNDGLIKLFQRAFYSDTAANHLTAESTPSGFLLVPSIDQFHRELNDPSTPLGGAYPRWRASLRSAADRNTPLTAEDAGL